MRRFMIVIPLLILSLACIFPFMYMREPANTAAKTGTLSVTINYTDTFYHETFNYMPDAPNIYHFVLVLPENEANRESASRVLYSLRFSEEGYPWISDPEAQWAEKYLYEAPGGRFTGEFAPGLYRLAAVFIAKEPPGETRSMFGGASTDLQPVTISAGEEALINITMTDDNGWACPWLYVFNGTEYEQRTEILRNVRDEQQIEITNLGAVPVVRSSIFLRISEEKAETTHLDQIYLIVNGERIMAGDFALDNQDNRFVLLSQGMTLDLPFALPEHLALEDTVSVTVVVAGYYVLDEVLSVQN